MSYLKGKTTHLVLASVFCVSLFFVPTQQGDANACSFKSVLIKCNKTATKNYEDGHYSLELYYEFQTMCIGAALSCVE
ncbi:hypothetical protein [Fodinibius halophilus]|uniref:Uncharacterized protein n=1 Tax=Fodinibius halophilus TaxID=1736908 RepID=A0A6M1TH78_9BACT|nr:hypothetical protein [Fodinibius halophilus]NGP90094.1 hypothetical protein [Fodinibius halophilus]